LVSKDSRKVRTIHFLAVVSNRSLVFPVSRPGFVADSDKLSARVHHSTEIKKSDDKCLFFGQKVGKKLGNAVVRNKIKRRIRHLCRLMHHEHQVASNLSIIIIPKKNFENILFSDLVTEFRKIFI